LGLEILSGPVGKLGDFRMKKKGYSGENSFFDNQIWGVDEVAQFTRYTKGTIYNLVYEGEIPFRKRRGKLWFIPNEIICWVKGEL
jgi:excisionase family DNA binding protein